LGPACRSIPQNYCRMNSKLRGNHDDTNYSKLSRLYVSDALNENSLVKLQKEDTNYVVNVMRMKSSSNIRVFNPSHGEFLAEVQCDKRDATLKIKTQLRAVEQSRRSTFPAVLFFAPIKKTRMKTLFEKATELGVEHIVSVVTQNTQYPIEASAMEQYRKICIQSAEQCERLTLPTLHPQVLLTELLAGSDNKVKDSLTASLLTLPLLVCAERLGAEHTQNHLESADSHVAVHSPATPLLFAVQQLLSTPPSSHTLPNTINLQIPSFSVFVGPEGGFTAAELDCLSALQHTRLVTLGRSVLRAETASIAALSAIACSVEAETFAKENCVRAEQM